MSWRARTLSFLTLVLKYALKGDVVDPFLLTLSPAKGLAGSVTFSPACWPWWAVLNTRQWRPDREDVSGHDVCFCSLVLHPCAELC